MGMSGYLEQLHVEDSEVSGLIEEELGRQRDSIELIASENFVSLAVMEAVGSPLTNKYAEGLPGKRYYGGCWAVDKMEDLARERAKRQRPAPLRCASELRGRNCLRTPWGYRHRHGPLQRRTPYARLSRELLG